MAVLPFKYFCGNFVYGLILSSWPMENLDSASVNLLRCEKRFSSIASSVVAVDAGNHDKTHAQKKKQRHQNRTGP